jgi:hypothetical protein
MFYTILFGLSGAALGLLLIYFSIPLFIAIPALAVLVLISIELNDVRNKKITDPYDTFIIAMTLLVTALIFLQVMNFEFLKDIRDYLFAR